ncbi:MAG: hypothetical protein ACRCYS_05675 [Beijerinckiaceae bacterium]
MTKAVEPTGLALLRVPFPPNQISKLPKGGVMLDYVGHAALTDRLLDTDPNWFWEPVAYNAEGLPAFDKIGGLWIRLHVLGQSRLGYGDAGGKTGGNAVKEAIGDALRNAAMRFGAALDLWHKGDLHVDETADTAPADRVEKPKPWREEGSAYPTPTALHKGLTLLERELTGCGDSDMVYALCNTPDWREFARVAEKYAPHYLRGGEPAPPEFEGLLAQAERMVKEFDAAQAQGLVANVGAG